MTPISTVQSEAPAPSESSDAALLDAARAGDAEALENLLGRHQARIYRFGMKMCRHPDDASDVLQETLLAMARSVRDFRGASSISTWLYTIARSFCLKKRRRSKFAPIAEESLDDRPVHDLPDPARGPEEQVGGREIDAAIGRAVDSLDPIYREALLLRDVEGLSAPEVAEVLGIRVGAVKSRLHRARLLVRQRLASVLGRALPPGDLPDEPCPDLPLVFSRHLEGDLGAAQCAQMQTHLDGCPRCRVACASLRRTLEVCRNTPAPRVPAPVQEAVRDALRRMLGHA